MTASLPLLLLDVDQVLNPFAASPAVLRFAGRRPLTWIDDALPTEAHAWAAKRRIPTLLIGIDPAEGLTRHVIEQSLQWADEHKANDQTQT